MGVADPVPGVGGNKMVVAWVECDFRAIGELECARSFQNKDPFMGFLIIPRFFGRGEPGGGDPLDREVSMRKELLKDFSFGCFRDGLKEVAGEKAVGHVAREVLSERGWS